MVVALAVLREGSEIVLFSHGMIAAGTAVSDIINGALIGTAGGLTLGILIYLGFVKMPLRYFFVVTTWMLLLLVAGMVSQGIGYLVAAGYFETLSTIVWNSEWLLSDKSIIGESLGVLVGYTSQPTIIQLLAYALTLTIMLGLIDQIDKKSRLSVA